MFDSNVPSCSPAHSCFFNCRRSAELWDSPDEFNPDRFGPLDGPMPNEVTEDFKYLPFGGGKRKCIGEGFFSQNGEWAFVWPALWRRQAQVHR